MVIDGVPEVVSGGKVRMLLRLLGVEPHDIAASGVHIGYDSIQVDVYGRNAEGHKYVDTATDQVVMHHVSIPIDWS